MRLPVQPRQGCKRPPGHKTTVASILIFFMAWPSRINHIFAVDATLVTATSITTCNVFLGSWSRTTELGNISVLEGLLMSYCRSMTTLAFPPGSHPICHNDAHAYHPGHRGSQGLTLVLCYIINKWWILSIIIYIMQSRIYRSKLTWIIRGPLLFTYYILCFSDCGLFLRTAHEVFEYSAFTFSYQVSMVAFSVRYLSFSSFVAATVLQVPQHNFNIYLVCSLWAGRSAI